MRVGATMKLVYMAVLLAFVAACSSAPVGSVVAGDSASALAERPSEIYRLGTGDQIRLIVFGEDQLSGEFVVDGSGAVSLPLIGEVEAAGRTVRELQRSIEGRLSEGYLVEPRVSAEVVNYRPFFIMGEVNEPGTYPYSDGLTVVNAVATAGGFTYRADERRVYIRRPGAAGWQEYRLTSETNVQPGDTLRIGERFF